WHYWVFPEVGCCGKFLLFGFNIVFWVLGKGVLFNISALTDSGGLDPMWLFVAVGRVESVLGFDGGIGALWENTFLLTLFCLCCGARGPNGWHLNLYFNCTDLNLSQERCRVPFSCRIRDPAEDVLSTQCGYSRQLTLALEQRGSIHTKDCMDQFEKWVQDTPIVVTGVFVGIALLQIFGICPAQNLVSAIKAVRASW
uniref:Tetraspanin n=1 Tax=Ailuropoda melanoleuca TaxID=9646 RepID=A0A7N5JU56_AILME